MTPRYTDTVLNSNTNLDVLCRLGNRHGIPMRYFQRLADLRKAQGLTQAGLAEKLGVEQPTVQRWEKGKREPNIAQLVELARVLGVEPSALLDSDLVPAAGPRLYVKGSVAAGVWQTALESPQSEWKAFTGRPDINAKLEHRFGLRITGDSMNEIYPPGTIVECVSVFGHTEPEPGKRVVVLRTNQDGEVEATVKELVEQAGELWLVPRSTNPEHRPIRVRNPEPDIVEIKVIAVVVASVRPE